MVDNVRISTMTQIGHLSSLLHLESLFNNLEENSIIKYIQWGDKKKGINHKEKKRKSTIKEINNHKKYFYNQVTIHILKDKIINLKIFNNGGIQMTGIKYFEQGKETIELLLDILDKLDIQTKLSIFESMKEYSRPIIKDIQIVNTVSDFDLKKEVKREVLHRFIVDNGYYSSYESVIYPGVNIKYYYNPVKQNTGICNCEGPCDGKGKNGYCKKITIAVFKSGKALITGANDKSQIEIAYHFITNFIDSKKEFILV